jgi:glycosyltransferase involved in cell wall biosynthesis
MPGTPIDDARLGDEYARAAVVAVASDHEGFCVPLLEAMAFDVPVVAFAAAAVPETLGDAGLLLDDRDPLVWAAALARASSDLALGADLVARGRERLQAFSAERVRSGLFEALAGVGVLP